MVMNYENDFYTWTQQQAHLLRSHQFAELDVENLIEELESMGRSEKRAVTSRLTVLLMHLLKWRFQVDRRSTSWRLTIQHQRLKFHQIIRDNPGLKPQLAAIYLDAYQDAIFQAAQETGLPVELFPTESPWQLTEVISDNFYPE